MPSPSVSSKTFWPCSIFFWPGTIFLTLVNMFWTHLNGLTMVKSDSLTFNLAKLFECSQKYLNVVKNIWKGRWNRQKKNSKEQLFCCFLCIVKQKKNLGVFRKILKFFDFQKSLSKLGPTMEDFNSSWFWLLRGSPFTLW